MEKLFTSKKNMGYFIRFQSYLIMAGLMANVAAGSVYYTNQCGWSSWMLYIIGLGIGIIGNFATIELEKETTKLLKESEEETA